MPWHPAGLCRNAQPEHMTNIGELVSDFMSRPLHTQLLLLLYADCQGRTWPGCHAVPPDATELRSL